MSRSDPTRETRQTCIERDNCKCVICGADLHHIPASLHHRRMRSHKWAGLNQPSNLICVCGSGTTGCHGRIHAHPEESYKNGWLVSAYCDNPETIPMKTYDGYVMLDNVGSYEHIR